MSDLARTIQRLIVEKDSVQLQIVIDNISPTIAGTHDPADAVVRAAVIEAAENGLIEAPTEVLVNAIKDNGEGASKALAALRERMAATIHYLACRSGIDYEESDMQITEGLWEAAQRYDDVLAHEKGAKFPTYAHPWMKKMSRPRASTKPGSKDQPFRFWLEEFMSSGSNGGGVQASDGPGEEVNSDPFLISVGLYVEEDHGMAMDVAKALSNLEDVTREVIKLNILEGRSIPEVSKITGMTVWAVKCQINVGKALLNGALQSYENF